MIDSLLPENAYSTCPYRDVIRVLPNDEKPYKLRGIKIYPPKFKIDVDLDGIDLNQQYSQNNIKPFKPYGDVTPYSDLKIFHLDIETDFDSLNEFSDPKKNRIISIGLMNNDGKYHIFRSQNEAEMLWQLYQVLETRKPDVITVYNGFDFDIPYLMTRSEILGVEHPFKYDREVCYTIAQRNTEPTIYQDIKIRIPGKKHCAIIDLYHQILAWDFSAKKLEKFRLKNVPVDLGLRKEARLDLGAEGMRECIDNEDWETYDKYLVYDLEDTKLLADFLLPPIYYQKLFLPTWQLQYLSHAGNGEKWNDILKRYYKGKYGFSYRAPSPWAKFKFNGGHTYASPGVKRDACKIDFTSLYPHIMLHYGIYSWDKDPDAYMLSCLKYMLETRIHYKELSKDGDVEAGRMQASLKILINSAFGCLGTKGINYNNYFAASMVTAIGRKMLMQLMDYIETNDGQLATCDTDGIVYTSPNNISMYRQLQQVIPNNFNIEYEWQCDAIFVPANKKQDEGKRKNYIMINVQDGKIIDDNFVSKKITPVKVKGALNSRSRCPLEKTFQKEWIKRYIEDGYIHAQEYFDEVKDSIIFGSIDTKQITITRKVTTTDVKISHIGKPGEIVSYYRAKPLPKYSEKTGRKIKPDERFVAADLNEQYDRDYYLKLVSQMREELNI